MSRFNQLSRWLLALLVLVPGVAAAQGDPMAELYGEGVHRFFCGDYHGADELLSQVVDSGSLDPRAHYFRGLTRDMLGGGGELDYETGARLEAEGKMVVDVGAALTRIQGATRGKIELARRDARVLRRQQLLAEEAMRRAQTPAPPAEDPVPPAPAETNDPFGEAGLSSDEKSVDEEQPTQPALDAQADPFQDDPAPATPDSPDSSSAFDAAPDASSPFGTEPAAEADASNPFDAAPATDDASNPFGEPAPASGDSPFDGF